MTKKELVNTLQKFYDDNKLSEKLECMTIDLIGELGGEINW